MQWLKSIKQAPELAPGSILAVIPALNEERHIETCIRSLDGGSHAT
jgi:succinoglycan biosynthesis protein ExoA